MVMLLRVRIDVRHGQLCAYTLILFGIHLPSLLSNSTKGDFRSKTECLPPVKLELNRLSTRQHCTL